MFHEVEAKRSEYGSDLVDGEQGRVQTFTCPLSGDVMICQLNNDINGQL